MTDANGRDERDEDYREDRTPPPEPPPQTAIIESRVNIDRLTGIEMATDGSVGTKNYAQVLELAKTLSLAESMVPRFMRNQVWTCAQIVVKAIEWGMSPLSVASMAYEVRNKKTGERTIAYMSQLHHAVLERRAPLKERLRVRYEGEGDDMVCIVTGTFKGEEEPREWKSEPLKAARKDKQSPLWWSKPRVQMFYDTSRDWHRIYCPDIGMGIYDRDEMEESGFIDVTPRGGPEPEDDGGLTQRLSESALARAGFSVGNLAAIDGGRRQAENQAGRPADSSPPTGGQGGEATPSPPAASPPPPVPGSEAAMDAHQYGTVGGPPAPEEGKGVSEPPEGEESRPRARTSRRRAPDGDQPGLV